MPGCSPRPTVIVLLAGGTGGAKLARGFLDLVGPERLVVVANTGDDVEVHGVHVSPDPDLVTYWLADVIDERGWGIAGDTWSVMDALESAGRPTWFRLGDRDLAFCLIRTELLRSGVRLTDAHAEVVRASQCPARVLPMSDEPVRTFVRAAGVTRSFQEFMIVDRAEAAVERVELRGIEAARPTQGVLAAIEQAEAIVIGPSNPVISIGPILALPGLRESLRRAAAPVVAVSPWVGGRAVKGPTDRFAAYAKLSPGTLGVEGAYGDVLDGILSDEPHPRGEAALPVLVTDTLMTDAGTRRAVAAATLEFAQSLATGGAAPAERE